MSFDHLGFDSLQDRATRVGNLLEVGAVVGLYRLDKRLGKGGMGEVWRAIDPTRGDEDNPGYVALKFLPQEIQASRRELRRANETFRAVQALQHPNICPAYFLQEIPRFGHVLAMKYIDGLNLLEYRDAYVEQHGQFPLSEVIRVLRPIAAALDYAHRPSAVHTGVASVIHRDIKPENILISHDGKEVQIVDFGLAAQVRLSMTRVSKVEMESVGTRSYMAPEQWRGQFQDHKTDQYALSVVAYELLADRLPFEAADPFQLRECVLNEPVPTIPDQPESVNQALAKALSKSREERFDNCDAFIKALQPKANPDSRLSLLMSPFDSATAKAGQEAWAKYLKVPVEWTNSIGMKFRLIPPGEFLMGAEVNEQGAYEDEKPPHSVKIARPFYLGVYPVTQAEYQEVSGTNPSHFRGSASLPVERVSWHEAQEFLRRLRGNERGRMYRLPTEAEWEYACRAGTTTPFWFGKALNGQLACSDGRYPFGTNVAGPCVGGTVAVGSYGANPFGIYDQHGLVLEWCQDWYSANYFQQIANQIAVDPTGPELGHSRSLRGGAWGSRTVFCRSSTRNFNEPGYQNYYIGFRAVLETS